MKGKNRGFQLGNLRSFLSIGLSEISKTSKNVNLGNPLPNSGTGFRSDVENFMLTRR
jgi:hypothetical protein